MSSLRNAVKRKEHKERSQPDFRKKVGLLEKKKDYKERSNDYHKKEKTIKHLKSIAQERNPDEFYFAMQSGQTVDGVHHVSSSQANKYSQEELALMRTQDIGYLRTKAQSDLKKIDRMKASLHFLGAVKPSNHTIFVDDEREAAQLDPVEYFDTPAELLDRSFNRPRRSQLAQKVGGLASTMEMKKALAGKGRKRKMPPSESGASIPVFKWKKERKK